MQALITDIQRFSLSDGPGIRTTVFSKGCNMRCTWCHNPETLSFSRELMHYPDRCIGCMRCFSVCPTRAHKLENGVHTVDRGLCINCGKCANLCYAEALVMSGKEMTVDDIMNEVRRDKAYYDASGGGVTLSGGEVLCHVDFMTALAKACHAEGISVAIETNLSFPYEKIEPLLAETDVVMADLKLFDDAMHRHYTGVSNKTTLENLARIDSVPLIVRTPLIPTVTATRENLRAIAKSLVGKKNLVYYQLLNFNPLGASKYDGIGKKNPFTEVRPYSGAEMAEFGAFLSDIPVKVKVGE